ncbi:MAG TPA: hypothetical protein VF406_21245 [Thermodesulfobacteriota bacterium]
MNGHEAVEAVVWLALGLAVAWAVREGYRLIWPKRPRGSAQGRQGEQLARREIRRAERAQRAKRRLVMTRPLPPPEPDAHETWPGAGGAA